MNNTEKLIQEVTKHGIVTQGEVCTNKDGIVYRYDMVQLKYKHASYWLANLFAAAAKDNGKEYSRQFFYNEIYSFYFDRATFKSDKDGKIQFSKLVILNS